MSPWFSELRPSALTDCVPLLGYAVNQKLFIAKFLRPFDFVYSCCYYKVKWIIINIRNLFLTSLVLDHGERRFRVYRRPVPKMSFSKAWFLSRKREKKLMSCAHIIKEMEVQKGWTVSASSFIRSPIPFTKFPHHMLITS